MSGHGLGLVHRWVRPRGHQVCYAAARIAARHQGLADQHHIRSGPRQVDHIMRSAYAGLRYPDNAVGNERRQPAEGRGLDLERLLRALTPMIVAPASTARRTSSAV